ncbi:MAG: DUF2849 domain-containing protein [Rhodobacteraceae bacterium]|nr:DUF2849 domain-containing protein [Paracoccaceae bacterium]
MTKAQHPQVVTANHLLDGDVIYLTEALDWTRQITEAAVAHDPRRAAALLDEAQSRPHEAVGPYLTPVALDARGRPGPLHFRELYRTTGPTFLTDEAQNVPV